MLKLYATITNRCAGPQDVQCVHHVIAWKLFANHGAELLELLRRDLRGTSDGGTVKVAHGAERQTVTYSRISNWIPARAAASANCSR